jgi:hypothetical protein
MATSLLRKLISPLAGTIGTCYRIGMRTKSPDAHRTRLWLELLEPRWCPDVAWTGAGGNALWSNRLNWDLERVPVANETIRFNDGAVDSTMDMTFNAPVDYLVVSGYTGKITLTKNLSVKKILFQTRKIAGSSTLTIVAGTDTSRWRGIATWGANDGGQVLIEPGASLEVTTTALIGAFSGTIDGWSVMNQGTVDWTGGGTISIMDGGTFTNSTGAVLDISPTGGDTNSLMDGNGSDANRFVNDGQVTVSGGTVEMRVNVNDNGGTWDISGNTSLTYAGVYCGPTFTIAQDKILTVRSVANKSHSFAFGTFAGPGTLVIAGGTVEVNGDVDVNNAQQTGGTLAGGGTVNINASYRWSSGAWSGLGIMKVRAGSNLDVVPGNIDSDHVRRKIENDGTVTVDTSVSLFFANGADIQNNSGGLVKLRAHFMYPDPNDKGARFIEGGETRKLAGNRFSEMKLPLIMSKPTSLFRNEDFELILGEVTMSDGQFLMGEASAYIDSFSMTGGSFYGSGEIEIEVTLFDQVGGTLFIDDSSTCQLVINGDYRQGSSATLVMGIGPNGTSQWFYVLGTATLAGVLSITLYPGYTPAPGDPGWYLIDARNPTIGQFSSIVAPDGIAWEWLAERTFWVYVSEE